MVQFVWKDQKTIHFMVKWISFGGISITMNAITNLAEVNILKYFLDAANLTIDKLLLKS